MNATVTTGQTVTIADGTIEAVEVTVTTDDGARHLLRAGTRYYEPCGRCSGMSAAGGRIDWAAHVAGGVCFACNGGGVGRTVIDGTEAEMVKKVSSLLRAAARRRAKAEAAAAEKWAASQAKVEAWRAANPEVAAVVDVVKADIDACVDASGRFDYEAGEVAREAAVERWGHFAVDLATSTGHVGREGLTEAQGAALVTSVERTLAREAAQIARAEASAFYGKEGDKVAATGVVEVSVTIDTAYGLSRLVVVRGTGEFEGATFKVFGSGKTLWDTAKGDVVTLAGAIKGHEERDGVRQTVLTRAKATVTEAAAR